MNQKLTVFPRHCRAGWSCCNPAGMQVIGDLPLAPDADPSWPEKIRSSAATAPPRWACLAQGGGGHVDRADREADAERFRHRVQSRRRQPPVHPGRGAHQAHAGTEFSSGTPRYCRTQADRLMAMSKPPRARGTGQLDRHNGQRAHLRRPRRKNGLTERRNISKEGEIWPRTHRV